MVPIISLLCAAICLWAIVWKKVKIRKCTEPILGEYIGSTGYSGKVYSPIVTLSFLFKYSYHSTIYQGEHSINSVSTITLNRTKYMEKLGYQRGNTYTIFINPDNPKQYITKEHDSNFVLLLGFVFLVLFAFWGGIYI